MNKSAKCRQRLLFGLALVSILMLGAGAATTQQESADPSAELRERFRVLPLSDGLLLESLEEIPGVTAIEVRAGVVAIDGESMSGAALRERLGEASAELILAVSALPPEQQRALLRPAPEPVEPAEPLEPAEPVEPAEPPEPVSAEAPPRVPPPTPPAPPSPPRSRRAEDKVVMGGSLHIRAGERVKDLVVMGGSITMEGEATGDVTVMGGSARINGPVAGDVALIGGSLALGPNARIAGDLAVLGGSIDQHPDAELGGEVTSIVGFPFGLRMGKNAVAERIRKRTGWVPPWQGHVGRVVRKIFNFAMVALLALLAVLVARRPVGYTAERIGREPWKAGLVGLAITILTLPVTLIVVLLLALSIIGIPLLLLVPFALLGVVLVGVLGYSAAAYRIGEWARERLGGSFDSPYLTVLLGVAALAAVGVTGAFLRIGPMRPLGSALLLVGAILNYVAVTVGFGGTLLAWLDRRNSPPPAAARPPELAPETGIDSPL